MLLLPHVKSYQIQQLLINNFMIGNINSNLVLKNNSEAPLLHFFFRFVNIRPIINCSQLVYCFSVKDLYRELFCHVGRGSENKYLFFFCLREV